MKKLLLCFVLLSPVYAFNQFLAADATLEEAKKIAVDKNKPIAVWIASSSCNECNTIAEKSLQNASLHSLLATDFVVLQVSPDHQDLPYIQGNYNYRAGNIVLFLDKQGALIHRMNRSTSRYQDYIDECKIALQQQSVGEEMRVLEKTALEGKLDDKALLDLMKKRQAVGLPIDTLLDMYATDLPTSSLRSLDILQDIVRLAPMLQSRADMLLRKDMDRFNQAWYAMPLQDRVLINQQIIAKSLNRSIQSRNFDQAYRVAVFSKEVSYNPVAGNRSYAWNLLEYYRGIGDTTIYIKGAINFYDRYYMSISRDSILHQDSLLLEKNLLNTPVKDTLIRTRTNMTVRKTVTTTGFAQSVCLSLNRAARDVYNMTKDTSYLRKALEWSAYGNSLYENSEVMDIYARLLFVLDNNTAKAIELEEQAIALREKRGLDSKLYATTLENLKKGKL